MKDITLEQLESARAVVARHMAPTPHIRWPLLVSRTGAKVWVKHENHTPIGAFKIRGGLNYMNKLKSEQPDCPGVITATRGNHGQSVALAASLAGLPATVLVPFGNNPEKNAAMKAFGADLIEHGADFQEAYEHAGGLAAEKGLRPIPPYHPWLIEGVGTYALEFLSAEPDLDTVYVPIGMGSGISGLIAARDGLGLTTRIVGVVAENAPCYALSFEAGKPVATHSSDTLADGMACRTPDAAAVEVILRGAERIVQVSEDEILAAMGHYFTDTHNAAEGAGAAPLAALIQERDRMAGRKVGLILSGGNADRDLFTRALERKLKGDRHYTKDQPKGRKLKQSDGKPDGMGRLQKWTTILAGCLMLAYLVWPYASLTRIYFYLKGGDEAQLRQQVDWASLRQGFREDCLTSAPVAVAKPKAPPRGLMEAAEAMRRLEKFRDTGDLSSDEYAKERQAIEKTVRAKQPPPTFVVMTPKETISKLKDMKKSSGPSPAVHLASFRSIKQANRGWQQIERTHKAILGGLSHQVTRVNLGKKGTYYRLKAGPLKDAAAAKAMCRKLKRRRQFCQSTVIEGS